MIDRKSNASPQGQIIQAERTVFKVVPQALWAEANRSGAFHGSADDVRDGFIHLSTLPQLTGTLAKHFAGIPDLFLVAFDPDHLGPQLRYEPSRGGALFPHYYGALPVRLALWTKPIRLTPEGTIDCNHEIFRC